MRELRERFDADRAARFSGQEPVVVAQDPGINTEEIGIGRSHKRLGNSLAAWLANMEAWRVERWLEAWRVERWRNELTLRTLEMYSEYEPGCYIECIAPTPLLRISAPRTP